MNDKMNETGSQNDNPAFTYSGGALTSMTDREKVMYSVSGTKLEIEKLINNFQCNLNPDTCEKLKCNLLKNKILSVILDSKKKYNLTTPEFLEFYLAINQAGIKS